ncbi:MAG: hypothetical protein IPH37_06545 [Burkholderiales bacterium]|nr:hypothetical protein [Burkholderiales bacterium]
MPLSVVVATVRGRACPLHRARPALDGAAQTLVGKSPKETGQKPKDQRQGEVLLDATRYFLSDSHPLDIDFVLALPEELQPHFNAWCESRHFVPQNSTAF